jgi:threonine-phosphate decarboxylase
MASDPEVLDRIHAQQPEWSVSVPAQIAGAAALETDPQYLKTAREMIAAERKRMTQAMENMGLRVFPGEANYIFFSSEIELYQPLLDRGILIRNCDNYRGLKKGDYRTAVLRPEENNILLRALAEIVQA